jgi:hypothetical protein
MLVSDDFPELSEELQTLLRKLGEVNLAEQVPGLKLADRCRCGDDFCATIYTQPKPKKAYEPSHRNVSLQPAKGMIILDIVEERIACVEILYRDEVRNKLLKLLP